MIETINNWKPEVRSLLKTLVAHGCEIISSNNGEDRMQFKGRMADFIDHLIACDEAHLTVKAPDGKNRTLFLVLGNSPGELVSDYTMPADSKFGEDVIDKVTEAHGAAWEGRAQPKLRGAYVGGKFVKEARALAARNALLREVNAVIHTRNLYMVNAYNHEQCRVIDGHINADGHVCVRDLYRENLTYRVEYHKFHDGALAPVEFQLK